MSLRGAHGVMIAGAVLVAAMAGAFTALWLRSASERPRSQLVRGFGARVPSLRRAARLVAVRPVDERVNRRLPPLDRSAVTLAEQHELMLLNMERGLSLDAGARASVEAILRGSTVAGTGNSRPTKHPMTRAECLERRRGAALVPADEGLCGAPNMVALFDPDSETERDARVCVDQYEFPNVPCEYPLVWVTALEATQLCQALGKRLCDAHEWEGACAGRLGPAEDSYAWKGTRVQRTYEHNRRREVLWAYGPTERMELCGTGGAKSPRCVDVTWNDCGSNTFPVGSFPDCVSRLGVYDLHGNAAEHMSLPIVPDQIASGRGYGQTEMKGSWFASGRHRPHPDDCYWRAPGWHASSVGSRASHANYHLGFRCCKSVGR